MTSKSELETLLRKHGSSITKQRQLVFDLLMNSEPLTMYKLYELTHGQLDRASLYRTITLFETLGIAQRVNVGWKYKIELSDKFSEHHHHLACITCGWVIPINQNKLENFIEHIGNEHSFQIVDHQIELQGYCMDCQKAKTSTEAEVK